jgi:exosortase
MSLVESAPATPIPSEKPRLDFATLSKSPLFWPIVMLAAGVILIFWRLWGQLLGLWLGADGYYSHGFLVPLIAGYIVYRNWDRMKSIPVKPGYIAIPVLLLVLYVARIASVNRIDLLMSLCLMATLLFSSWIIAGWRWMLALSPSVLYLSFCLPLWTALINNYTNPLQIISTDVAYYVLKVIGKIANFDVVRTDPTVILTSNFNLNIEVPCSGLKLLLALAAFTTFFMLIARLKWWANLIMVGFVFLLALFVNGLRIALIGVVGELRNPTAGHEFHDYSGYVTLIICFFILFKMARLLGWKD